MKKARLELMGAKNTTMMFMTQFVELSDDSTDEDLFEKINEVEIDTERVCNDWEWYISDSILELGDHKTDPE